MTVAVSVIDSVDRTLVDDFNRLVPQLSTNAPVFDRDALQAIMASPANTVLAARIESRTVGLLTLVTITLATGVCARVEDVVVDEAARGHGVGLALVEAALEHARQQGADKVDLTSRSSREAAHRLYEKAGFSLRDTNVYRYQLK